MKTDIGFVCGILEIESEVYKKSYDEAITKRKKDIEAVQKIYVPNTPKYRSELEAVEQEFSKTISQLQKDFATAGANAIRELRDLEMQRVQTVDETKLRKIKAVKDVPLTRLELEALVQKFGIKDDYWSSRLIQTIADNNGISDFEIESSFDTKMSVLNQLEQQMEKIIRYYPSDIYSKEGALVRHGYLTERILQNAKDIYGGKMRYESDEKLEERAYLTILSRHGDIEKGFAIQNALRNAKGEVRNLLLCRLAKAVKNKKISEFSVELSGNKEEIESFKNGKARAYIHARDEVERIMKATKKETIDRILEINSENEFMPQLVEKAKKKSERLRELMESKDVEEQEEQQDSDKEEQQEKTADDYYKEIYDGNFRTKQEKVVIV